MGVVGVVVVVVPVVPVVPAVGLACVHVSIYVCMHVSTGMRRRGAVRAKVYSSCCYHYCTAAADANDANDATLPTRPPSFSRPSPIGVLLRPVCLCARRALTLSAGGLNSGLPDSRIASCRIPCNPYHVPCTGATSAARQHQPVAAVRCPGPQRPPFASIADTLFAFTSSKRLAAEMPCERC